MLAEQWELRINIMVELRFGPRFGGVASVALLPARAVVNVPLAVAFSACRWHTLVALSSMTPRAFDGLVTARKREIGLAVIKSCGRFPALVVVAVGTGLAQFAAMHIIFAMTGDARSGCCAELLAAGMARGACNAGVAAGEGKTRL